MCRTQKTYNIYIRLPSSRETCPASAVFGANYAAVSVRWSLGWVTMMYNNMYIVSLFANTALYIYYIQRISTVVYAACCSHPLPSATPGDVFDPLGSRFSFRNAYHKIVICKNVKMVLHNIILTIPLPPLRHFIIGNTYCESAAV